MFVCFYRQWSSYVHPTNYHWKILLNFKIRVVSLIFCRHIEVNEENLRNCYIFLLLFFIVTVDSHAFLQKNVSKSKRGCIPRHMIIDLKGGIFPAFADPPLKWPIVVNAFGPHIHVMHILVLVHLNRPNPVCTFLNCAKKYLLLVLHTKVSPPLWIY